VDNFIFTFLHILTEKSFFVKFVQTKKIAQSAFLNFQESNSLGTAFLEA